LTVNPIAIETLGHDSSEYIIFFQVKRDFRFLRCCILKERVVGLHFQVLSFKGMALRLTLGHDILNTCEERQKTKDKKKTGELSDWMMFFERFSYFNYSSVKINLAPNFELKSLVSSHF